LDHKVGLTGMGKRLLFLAALFLWAESHAQSVKRFSLEGQYGFIIPHSPELKPLSESNPYGFNLHYQVLKTDKTNWDACACFHFLGVQLSHYNFANPAVLGSATSISGTFEPILWQNNRLRISLLTGVGVSYLTEYFDAIENPDNIFFSSPISFLGFVSPKLEYRFSDAWSAHLSFAYNHISNGGQRQPNKGMNFPLLGLGINSYLQNPELPSHEKAPISKNWVGYIDAGFTTSEVTGSSARKPVFGLAVGAYRSVSRINALGGGLDIVGDYAVSNESPALMPAVFVANHFLFGKFDFSQRMALYLHKPDNYQEAAFYQRYLLMYHAVRKVSLGVSMKAHGHVAEHMDLRIAYRF
jgi:hypothetical protein